MEHYVEKCRRCDIIMSQCRCADKNKQTRWAICENCRRIMKEEEDNVD